jgi:hypothetical protein
MHAHHFFCLANNKKDFRVHQVKAKGMARTIHCLLVTSFIVLVMIYSNSPSCQACRRTSYLPTLLEMLRTSLVLDALLHCFVLYLLVQACPLGVGWDLASKLSATTVPTIVA